jgi:hypothetical protein
MRWVDQVRSWFQDLLPDRGDPADVAEKRRVWRALAERHGLTYRPGPHPGFFQGDRIEGPINGRDLRVEVDALHDIQKLVVWVSLACDASEPAGQSSPLGLVARHKARRLAAGLPPIDDELDAWGRALITGVFYLRERRLIYEHLYGIDEAMLERLLTTLPTWVQRLEHADHA